MRKQQITAFYLETLLLIVVFVGIILVLTRVFGIHIFSCTRVQPLRDDVDSSKKRLYEHHIPLAVHSSSHEEHSRQLL